MTDKNDNMTLRKNRGPRGHKERWQDHAFTAFAEGKKAVAVQREINGKVSQESDAPHLRTVQRWETEFGSLGEEAQREYRYVRWPESFGTTHGLPWEASAAVLELLGLYRSNRNINPDPAQEFRRPTVQEARWYFRVAQARPDVKPVVRWDIAGTMARAERLGDVWGKDGRRLAEAALLCPDVGQEIGKPDGLLEWRYSIPDVGPEVWKEVLEHIEQREQTEEEEHHEPQARQRGR